jgi:hypothetical protein
LKVERIKNRWFYNIGALTITATITFILIRHRNEGELQDYLMALFLSGTGFCAGARAYYFDRYIRIIKGKPIVDLWLFYDNTKFEWLMFIYFFARPVFEKKQDLLLEKTRIRINIFAIGTYIFLTGLILFLTLN